MFSTIRDDFYDYVQQLPDNMVQAAIKSAVYSFVISALFSGKAQVGAATAALAAIVSVISGLTMPFFREAFADHGKLGWHHQVLQIVINLTIAQLLINSLTVYRVNLIAGALFTVGLNLFLSGCEDQSTLFSPSYIIV